MQLELTAIRARHPTTRASAPPALHGVSLRLGSGEQAAVIGPSGAGKTTLLQLLGLALRPTEGRVLLANADPWALDAATLHTLRARLVLAPQVPPLPPRQRVVTAVLAGRLPHMGFWRSVASLAYPQDMGRAQAALEPFDLASKLFDRVDRLSGGERQRVGLARAWAAIDAGARLLLADEPLSALDPTHARQSIQALTGQCRERGVTLLASLHQVELAREHFPRLIGLREGRVHFDLPTQQVSPDHLRQLYEGSAEEQLEPPAQDLQGAPARPVVYCR